MRTARCQLLLACAAGAASARLVGELEPCGASWFPTWASAHALGQCEPRVATVLKHHTVLDWVAGAQPEPARAPGDMPLNAVAVMTHREFVLGCHSFESLFSHRMPTYMVFSHEFAQAWKLPELVRETATLQTQLLVIRRLPGELIARSVVLSLMQAQGAGDPEFLFFTHCDIHQLPRASLPSQPRASPTYVHAVEQLIDDFSAEKALRAAGRTAVRYDGAYGFVSPDFWRGNATCAALSGAERAAMPVFAMNAVTVESVARRNSLEGAVVHGVDVGGYVATGGLKQSARARAPTPANGSAAGLWLSDAGTWLEDHALLYDLALYRKLHATFALADAGDVLFHNEYFQPELFCRMGWTALRDNEVYLHYSSRLEDDDAFAARNEQLAVKGKTRPMQQKDGLTGIYHDVYARVDLEWVRAFQLELLYARMSPMARVREHVAANAVFASHHFLEWGNNVFPLFARASMLPRALLDAPGRGQTVGELIDAGIGALFAVAGYERVRTGRQLSAADDGYLALRRVSYPLARFFHVTYAPEPRSAANASKLPKLPRGCRYAVPPYTLGNDVGSCTLFLDLTTRDRRRIGVWAANYAQFPGEKVSGAPPVLRIPLSAKLRALGSPFVAAPGRSAPATHVLRSFAEVCARRGYALSPSTEALRAGPPIWRHLMPQALVRATERFFDERTSSVWPDAGPFLPEGNETWYARMRTMPSITDPATPDTDMFGFPQGVQTVPLRSLCQRASVRYTWRNKIASHQCSAMQYAPPAAGRGQMICCSIAPCRPTDAFRM